MDGLSFTGCLRDSWEQRRKVSDGEDVSEYPVVNSGQFLGHEKGQYEPGTPARPPV